MEISIFRTEDGVIVESAFLSNKKNCTIFTNLLLISNYWFNTAISKLLKNRTVRRYFSEHSLDGCNHLVVIHDFSIIL